MHATSTWKTTGLLVVLAFVFARRAIAEVSKDPNVARQRFENGVTAFEQKRFGDAIVEFRAAYDLSPVYSVLYNIGQVSVALGDSVGAIEAFEQYLHQGGASIDSERRKIVQDEITRQKSLIGTVSIQTRPNGAEVLVDGKSIGKTPLVSALRLSRGKHSIVALLDGHATQAREVEIAPGSALDLSVDLAPDGTPMAPSPTEPGIISVPTTPGTQHTTINVAVNQPLLSTANPTVSDNANSTDATRPNTLRTVSYVVGGLGITLGAVGTYLTLSGIVQAKDGIDRMNSATTGAAWDAGKSDYDSGKSRNQLGWIGVGTGALAVSTGVVLYVMSDKKAMRTSRSRQRDIAISAYGFGSGSGIIATTTW